MKKMRNILVLTLVVALFVGMFCFPKAGDIQMPEVSPEVETFVAEVFFRRFGYADSVEQCRIASVEEIHGSVAAAQYANLINYYYDTLDDRAFILARDSFLQPDAETREMGANGERLVLPTCRSITEEAMNTWVKESKPYLLSYTPIYPRPDRSKIDLNAIPDKDLSRLAKIVAEQEGQSATVVATPMPTIAPVTTPTPAPTSAPTSVTQPFPDVAPGDWFYEAVNAMKNSGIITGCDDGLFHPEQTITQGEFYTMLLRAGSFHGANIAGGLKPTSHWASGVLKTADFLAFPSNVEAGHENDLVDRSEAVYSIANMIKVKAMDTMKQYTDPKFLSEWSVVEGQMGGVSLENIPDHEFISSYVDTAAFSRRIGSWGGESAREKIVYAYNTGICKGVDEAGTFDPGKLLTRAEIAQLFYNAHLTRRINCFPVWKGHVGATWYDLNSTENVVR